MYLNKIMKKYLRLCGLLKYNIYNQLHGYLCFLTYKVRHLPLLIRDTINVLCVCISHPISVGLVCLSQRTYSL